MLCPDNLDSNSPVFCNMPFGKINIQKKGNGHPQENLTNVPQNLLYRTSRPITVAKKKDMWDLLKFIPPVHHHYNNNLKTERSTLELNLKVMKTASLMQTKSV
ncbi:hypothetical protein J6590_061338 [Homalodisca vitripennis]|nr:hypothetical protein J6590_061338 [Homalodisca vitripennis]